MARGEASIGEPLQHLHLRGDRRGWTKPYLNYLLCLAALSRHIDRPPRSVPEIGGGYGVLGEIMMSRSPKVRYVDLDIPPLMTVASYYLRALFGERVDVYDEAWSGRVGLDRSAVLLSWRIDDVDGPFDVFVSRWAPTGRRTCAARASSPCSVARSRGGGGVQPPRAAGCGQSVRP